MRSLLLLLLLLLLPIPLFAQTADEATMLFARLRQAAGFVERAPREQVYLHLDNNGYYEGETLWYRAYVVQAATLRPQPLSGVLYVELLDAAGQVMEQQTLPIDSAGRAEGSFVLDTPVRTGYYEVRAYTREMVNWGPDACFSRIVPVFQRPVARRKKMRIDDIDPMHLEIQRPAPNDHSTRMTPRIIANEAAEARTVRFYPEGGQRVAGLDQRIAFEVTGGEEAAEADTLVLCNAQGEALAYIPTLHQHRGVFTLPAEVTDGYVRLGRQHFPLPPADGGEYVMRVLPQYADGQPTAYDLRITATPRALLADSLLGLAVLCRGAVGYCDTLRMQGQAVELTLPLTALRGGVNQVVLFSATGRTLAQRLVWRDAPRREVHVEVRQNASSYAPYAPIVLQVQLRDALGAPIQTDCSLSVRAAESEFTRSDDMGTDVGLLLSSELRGYIRRPWEYFPLSSPQQREALDLLLMVQGWSANSFEEVCGRDSFPTLQPIEEHLTINGQVFRDNGHRQPMPDVALALKMYSQQGHALEAQATTDAEGRFAFVSSVDYEGDFTAQFTMKDAAGRPVQGRLALDRWFSPALRALSQADLEIHPPLAPDSQARLIAPIDTFVWADTIADYSQYHLREVAVKGKSQRKYKGFTGNRYTYQGGEAAGQRNADCFINLSREVDRYKDAGGDPGYILQFLTLLDRNAELEYVSETDMRAGQTAGEGDGGASLNGVPDDAAQSFRWAGRNTQILLNNSPNIPYNLDEAPAEWFRSVGIAQSSRLSKFIDLEPGAESKTSPGYLILLYEDPNAPRQPVGRNYEVRHVSGFATHRRFYQPNYRQNDRPTDEDVRRTLLWQPQLRTDEQGRATVILYNNGAPAQRLRVTLRGVTGRGEMVSFDACGF